jgi:UDP-glucose 4-epimerase
MVIPRLVRQAITGVPLTVHGDGTQTRCFAHVRDVVDALLRLLDEERAVGQTFNIGSGDEVSILELAKLITELTGSTSGIDHIPYAEAYGTGFEDMTRRVPDTARLRELTGWAPRRTLDDILVETIAEARAELVSPRR